MTINQFAQVGIVHILAISGLHIGFFMIFFQWLLTFIKSWRYGRIIHPVLVLLILLFYAFLVGLPASVFRTVTMCSIYLVGKLTYQRYPAAYLVLLSMVILLIYDPRHILQVGFQMSYFAVFGILFIRPFFKFQPSTKVLQWFWNLTTLTFSAQLAVAPLSIYYFHQFPGLFLLANWLILPLVGSYLIMGMLALVFLCLDLLPLLFERGLAYFTALIHHIVNLIAHYEKFVFTVVSVSPENLFVIYAVLVIFILWQNNKEYPLEYICVVVALFNLLSNSVKEMSPPKNEAWIIYQTGTSHLVVQHNHALEVYSREHKPNQYLTRSFNTYFKSKKIIYKKLKNVYKFNNKRLLIVDNLSILASPLDSLNILLLHQNPKIHMDRLLERVKPELIIIDGSNSYGYIRQWEKSFKKAHIPWHNTHKDGAYRLIP